MKKLFLTAIASLLLAATSSAQNYYSYTPDSYYMMSNEGHYFSLGWLYYENSTYQYTDFIRKHHIKQQVQINTVYGKRKTQQDTVEMHFNARGMMLSKKEGYTQVTNKYLNDTLLTSSVEKSKKHLTEKNYTFDSKGRVLSTEHYRDGKLLTKTIQEFTASGKIAQRTNLYKKRQTRMVYVYNEQDQLIRSQFFVNNKLKNTWIYECKQEGQLMASNKNEVMSSQCEYREEHADGSYIVFVRSIRYGKPYLTKRTYTADSVLIQSDYFEKDTVLMSSNHYDQASRTWTNFRYRKNKLTLKEITVLDEKNRVVLYEMYSGKDLRCFNRQTSKYDALGNRVEDLTMSGKGLKNSYKIIRKCDENGLIQELTEEKNGKILSKTAYQYQTF